MRALRVRTGQWYVDRPLRFCGEKESHHSGLNYNRQTREALGSSPSGLGALRRSSAHRSGDERPGVRCSDVGFGGGGAGGSMFLLPRRQHRKKEQWDVLCMRPLYMPTGKRANLTILLHNTAWEEETQQRVAPFASQSCNKRERGFNPPPHTPHRARLTQSVGGGAATPQARYVQTFSLPS